MLLLTKSHKFANVSMLKHINPSKQKYFFYKKGNPSLWNELPNPNPNVNQYTVPTTVLYILLLKQLLQLLLRCSF